MDQAVILLLKGLAIGVFVGLPTGPVGFLCIRRTITDGFWAGFLSGAGATLAHMFYSVIVIIGLQKIIHLFTQYQSVIAILRIFVLLILGYVIFKYTKKQKMFRDSVDTKTLLTCFSSSLFITLANPVQIVSFSATFILLNVFTTTSSLQFFLILGIFIGSLSSWFVLSAYILKIRHKFSDKTIVNMHRICGGIIMCIGAFFFIKDFLI